MSYLTWEQFKKDLSELLLDQEKKTFDRCLSYCESTIDEKAALGIVNDPSLYRVAPTSYYDDVPTTLSRRIQEFVYENFNEGILDADDVANITFDIGKAHGLELAAAYAKEHAHGQELLACAKLDRLAGMPQDEKLEIALDLETGRYGSFAANIGTAWISADLGNRQRLEAAFPDLFEKLA